jgi:hypothetical protein
MDTTYVCIKCKGFCKRCRERICICEPDNIRWKATFRAKIIRSSLILKENATEEETKFIDAYSHMLSRSDLFFQVNIFYSAEECKEIIAFGTKIRKNYEPINFDGKANRFQKTIFVFNANEQQNMEKIPQPIINIVNLIKSVHAETKTLIFKLLKSISPCEEQSIHTDDNILSSDSSKKQYSLCSFNILVALEPNDNITQLICYEGGQKQKIIILQGGLMCWRGDFLHGGAGYEKQNIRLFIGVGTEEFPNDGEDVGLFNDN